MTAECRFWNESMYLGLLLGTFNHWTLAGGYFNPPEAGISTRLPIRAPVLDFIETPRTAHYRLVREWRGFDLMNQY